MHDKRRTVLSAESARQQSPGRKSWVMDEKTGESWKDSREVFFELSASAVMLPIPLLK
jgi:hypothetical protein